MCASSPSHAEAFFSASGTALSQEVADGKINVQSACAVNTVADKISWRTGSQMHRAGCVAVTDLHSGGKWFESRLYYQRSWTSMICIPSGECQNYTLTYALIISFQIPDKTSSSSNYHPYFLFRRFWVHVATRRRVIVNQVFRGFLQ
jgi:hypothetical protein